MALRELKMCSEKGLRAGRTTPIKLDRFLDPSARGPVRAAFIIGILFIAFSGFAGENASAHPAPGPPSQWGSSNLSTSVTESQLPPTSIDSPPADFTIAFIGDQGMTSNSLAVLELIKAEGADMVLHQGDLAYSNDVNGWDQMITSVLGASFPYFASVGNHDAGEWDQYQQVLIERLNLNPEAICSGDYGINTFCVYKGIAFVLSGAGTMGSGHADFIRETFQEDQHLWRICSWHKNMNKMQVGGKGDETGWAVYEACREAGAMVATGHEHSYSRTYLMSSFEDQVIAHQSSTLEMQPGTSFAFVSGLGGKSIRNQDQDWSWMAAVYTSDQDADYGALFCTFNLSGQADHASCYFKDIAGKIADQFELTSNLGSESGSFVDVPADHWAFDSIEALYQAGYIAGCSTTPPMYCPDQTMTRAESAVFVERGVWSAGYIPSQPTLQVFTDVPLGEWFAKWADGLWEDGYTAGCGTSPLAFCPLQQHSMAEGAVFFLRMLNGPGFEPPPAEGIFTDIPASAWYARWVEAAYHAGLYTACQTVPDLRACPDFPLTRAMGAYMMTQAKGMVSR